MIKLSNRIVTVNRTLIFFGKSVFSEFDRLVRTLHPHGIFILADRNTRECCLPQLMAESTSLVNAHVMEIAGGEAAKSLENAEKLWIELLACGAGRNSLLINLGGGVVTDLGGFVAAAYKRGIKYINIPTSLMGQADAAIGGKTAVNLGTLKNQVGFFYAAEGVFIAPEFLKTLPVGHLRSGFAEVAKSTLVGNGKLWRRLSKIPVNRMLNLPVEIAMWQELIMAAITFKNKVVVKDYREMNHRKILNFGHTFGHAFEALSMSEPETPILHGEAVAAGMICAAFLSHRKTGLEKTEMETITSYLLDGFELPSFEPASTSVLMDIMQHDKKNRDGRQLLTLISKPGFPVINVACDHREISEALDFYNFALSGFLKHHG